jgi:LysM repeat protein
MYKKVLLISIFGLYFINADSQTFTSKEYIDSFKEIAMKEMVDYKIPASITLAQGLLESGSGNSRLAKQGNNHFGIKCKKTWTGCTILEDDDALQECFRCYTTAEESYKDHSKFLRDNQRYSKLFELDIMDYKGWAKGLREAGYATNQKYSNLLISTIERYNLAKYDTMIKNGYVPYSGYIEPNIEVVPNKVPMTVVQKNQTLETIAEQNDKTVRKINKYNDFKYHPKIEPGDVVYLRPKKRKASIPTHEVKPGETMWEISQKYAIKINSLYRKNMMEEGTEPVAGTVLSLRSKAASRPDTGRVQPKDVDEKVKFHTVAGGETLYSISRLYNVSVEKLVSMNNIQKNEIKVGQRLKVAEEENIEKEVKRKEHKVLEGETLYSISRKYNVGIDDIKKWNNLTSNTLKVGQTLYIHY